MYENVSDLAEITKNRIHLIEDRDRETKKWKRLTDVKSMIRSEMDCLTQYIEFVCRHSNDNLMEWH